MGDLQDLTLQWDISVFVVDAFVVGLHWTLSMHGEDHQDGMIPTAAAPLLAELGTWEPSGFAMPSSADTLSRARPPNQLHSLSGLLQAHPNSLQIKSCRSTLLSFHYFPELEVQGRLILLLPEIAAHELGRNRSNLSAGFRLCHVSDCSLPSQCKTLFPFTSHHFLSAERFQCR